MALNVTLIRTSFELILERDPEFAARFYRILFERYPQVKSMFGRNSAGAQQKMLAQALTAVVDHLEDGSWLAETLAALGAKHVGYGVSPEMYVWVGDALLAAMAEVLGDDWTPAHVHAWGEAYAAITRLMRAGEALAVA